MNKSGILMLAVVLFGFVSFASHADAYTDFSFTLSYDKVSGCPGYAIPIDAVITNNDDVTHTYFLSLEMPQGWETPDNGFIQPDITLASGESQTITFWVNPPPVEPGKYTVKVKAKNGGEISKTLEVEVLRCHDVKIEVEETMEVCENAEFAYVINLSNRGKEQEEFELVVTGSWGEELFREDILLGAGEEREVTANITSPGENGKITAAVASRTSYAKDEDYTNLFVKKCYDFDASLTPAEGRTCLGKPSRFVLSMTNLGTESDTYTILSPEWVVPDSDSITIPPGEEREIELNAYPELMGRTSFDVTVRSGGRANLKKTITGSVSAEECRGVAVIVTPAVLEVCQGQPAEFTVTVKNTGTLTESYDLEASTGVLEKNKVNIDAGEVETLGLLVATEKLETGEYDITVTGRKGEIQDRNSVLLVVKDCYSLDFGITPEEKEVCRGDEIEYMLVLKNTGEYGDNYTFVMGNKTIGHTSLEPGEIKMFSTKLRMDIQEGEYEFKFGVFSEHVSEETVSKITVKSEDTCYRVSLSSDDTRVRIEPGKGSAIAVKIENLGERGDFYNLAVEGPEWVHISEDSIALESGEEDYVYIYASPDYTVENGTYEISLKAESTRTKDILNFRIGVGVMPEPEEEEANETGNVTIETGIPTGAVVRATGTAGKALLLAVIIILIIIILAVKFVLFIR